MSFHAIIGANILDRLVKCPGSLKLGKGSLASHDKSKKGYTKNRIECNKASEYGMIVDELAKDYVAYKCGLREIHHKYVKPKHECDPTYYKPADDFSRHIAKMSKRIGSVKIDPVYDLSKYMPHVPNCEFRVQFNPDFVIMNSRMALVVELSTAYTDDRNKMFQVICGAVGLIEYSDIDYVVCEVYNSTTKQVQATRLSREELEAFRDDVIIPTLEKVRDAVQSEDIEEYRHRCSWCEHFCICKDEGCRACKEQVSEAQNEVWIDVSLDLNNLGIGDQQEYLNLFK